MRFHGGNVQGSNRPRNDNHSVATDQVDTGSGLPTLWLMKYGVNTFLFTSPFTTRSTRLLAKIKQLGFDAVEIAVEDPAHIDPHAVRRELDKIGLACSSVCSCTGGDRDLRGTPKQQKISLAYLRALIDYAAVLGAPRIIGPVYSAVGRADAVPRDEYARQWKVVKAHLKTLAAEAAAKGIVFCLEPLNRFETDFINTCEQGLKMVKEVNSPGLKLMLDTFHMNIEEKNQAAAIRKAGKLLAHLHACGCDRGTPGGDHIDWTGIAKALKDIKYGGDVVIESFAANVKLIAKAAAIWRKIEPSQDDIAIKGLANMKKMLGGAR
jgi:D-psicose/D-tagatose/L-ribulose 3-epimerase